MKHWITLSSLKKNSNEKSYFNDFKYVCALIVLFTVIYFIGVQLLHTTNESRGTFGDLFGGLNTIFSGFAFSGVLVTIIMQMRELKDTRLELKKSAEAQEKSQQALNDQLKSMELTSKIQILESFKESIENKNSELEKEKYELAQKIIRQTTYNYFLLDEHIEFLMPKITTKTIKFSKEKSSSGFQTIDLEFENNGPKSIISGIKRPDTFYFSQLKSNPKNQFLSLTGKIREGNKVYILLLIQGKLFPVTWKQEISIFLKNGLLDIKINDPILKSKEVDIESIVSNEKFEIPKDNNLGSSRVL